LPLKYQLNFYGCSFHYNVGFIGLPFSFAGEEIAQFFHMNIALVPAVDFGVARYEESWNTEAKLIPEQIFLKKTVEFK